MGSDIRGDETACVNSRREQNQQVAAGALGRVPAPAHQTFSYQLDTLGPLSQASEFADIILRASVDGTQKVHGGIIVKPREAEKAKS